MFYKYFWLTVISVAIPFSALAQEPEDVKTDYQKKLTEIQNTDASDFYQLGKWAKDKKLFGPAKTYFKKALEVKPDYPEVDEALSENLTGDIPNNYFDIAKECRKKIQESEQKCANRLTELAKYCKSKNLAEEKEFCINEALKYDFNNKSARDQKGEVKVDAFGWLMKTDAEKVKNGLIKANGKWLPKNEVEKLKAKWEDAWEFKSDHYLLKTNIPFNKAHKALEELETLYDAALNMFYGLDGFELPKNEFFDIFYFENQEDFQVHTAQCDPNAKEAPGYYNRGDKAVHIWQFDVYRPKSAGGVATNEHGTISHESIHQLLCLGTGSDEGQFNSSHYWASEAMSTYFETMKINNGTVSFGNQTVKTLWLKKNLPDMKIGIKNLVNLGRADFNSSEVQNKYSQTVGLALFLMQHEKYKLRFLEYIIAAHKGKLDKSFDEFMKIDDMDKFEKEWLEFVKKKI
ncbi:MAG: DUF1570 domain-containing protein [Planctomycetota bacterium]